MATAKVSADGQGPRLAPVERASPPSLRFETIYRAHFEDVRRWVRALGGPDADRDDLVQDVFIVVHRRLPDFDGQNLAGWLYQIARHRVRDFRRLRWFRALLGRAPVDDTLISATDSPESALSKKEAEQVLTGLLSRLPEAQRTAFVLFEVDGYSGEEIARLHGVSINTVWARIHKARKRLSVDLVRSQGRPSLGGIRP